MAINLSPFGRIRYYSKFPWAIPYYREGSHVLLTRLPLPIARAFDLHVLGLPPAFVLSQDQTLRLKDLILTFGLEVNPRICVTGTFTLDAQRIRVASTGAHHGDGFETQYRQSLFDDHDPLPDQGIVRQDSAACVSLPSDSVVKEQSTTKHLRPPLQEGLETTITPWVEPSGEPRIWKKSIARRGRRRRGRRQRGCV